MMNRLARTTLCLLLVGFLGISSVGMGLCYCSDGSIVLGTGCCGDCRNSEDAPVCQQNSKTASFPATAGYSSADCTYVPLASGAMLLASSQVSRPTLSTKGPFLPVYQADCLDSRADGGVRADASRARCASVLTAGSLLAQRTIVLRI
jgi:hypothetical protein